MKSSKEITEESLEVWQVKKLLILRRAELKSLEARTLEYQQKQQLAQDTLDYLMNKTNENIQPTAL